MACTHRAQRHGAPGNPPPESLPVCTGLATTATRLPASSPHAGTRAAYQEGDQQPICRLLPGAAAFSAG